jgi:hypothetical protein
MDSVRADLRQLRWMAAVLLALEVATLAPMFGTYVQLCDVANQVTQIAARI